MSAESEAESEAPAVERPGRLRRWLSWGGVAVVVVLLGLAAYSCFWPQDRSSYSAPTAWFRQNGVTYLANGPLYVVAQPDGSLLALDQTPRVHADVLNGCVIRWRADLDGGVFQEDQRCGGAEFNRDGTPRGSGLPMLHHPLRLAGKSVVVDIRQCVPPEEGPAAAPRPCSAFRA